MLFRSLQGEEHATRIDLLFKPARHIAVPTTLVAPSIFDVAAGDVELPRTLPALADGEKLFRVDAKGRGGFIIAKIFRHFEDSGTYWEQSAIFMGGLWAGKAQPDGVYDSKTIRPT